MKKATVLAVVISLCLLGAILQAKAGKPHGRFKDPKVYIPLREEMTRMEMGYVNLEMLSSGDTIKDEEIIVSIEKMQDALGKIQKINPDERLTEALGKLSQQLTDLKRQKPSQNPKLFKLGLDQMFQTCFRCHSQHAPLM